jgi:hypothetical protein
MKKSCKKILGFGIALALTIAPAFAQQSAPNWSYGYVPTPAEWNFWFAKKTDWPGQPSCLVTGCTLTGPVLTTPSVAGAAGLNVPPGVAPTAPNAGDIWTSTAPLGMYVRLGTTNYNLLSPVHAPLGRITLTANTPVMTATASAQTTLRYDCATNASGGSGVWYFDGVNDQIDFIAACEVTDAMVSAASAGQVVSGQIYDLWWAHGGANRICLAMSTAVGGGGGWASDAGGSSTSRGTGYTQLDYATRAYITNKNAISNCFNGAANYGTLLANQATYLGTVLASANGQVSYIFGASASGGTAGVFGVCNPFNQVLVTSAVIDTGATYTYSSATIRQSRASAGMQHQVVNCLGTQAYDLAYASGITTTATAAAQGNKGIGLNSTTTYASQRAVTWSQAAAAMQGSPVAILRSIPGFGLQTFSGNEASDGTNAHTFDAQSTDNLSISFMN